MAFKFTFGCDELDNKNWAVDFGGLRPLKQWLEDTFDHKTVIDINDPKKDKLLELETHGLAQITQLDGVGAEKFAEHAFKFADKLVGEMTNHRCYCVSAECMEHGSNSAIYSAE